MRSIIAALLLIATTSNALAASLWQADEARTHHVQPEICHADLSGTAPVFLVSEDDLRTMSNVIALAFNLPMQPLANYDGLAINSTASRRTGYAYGVYVQKKLREDARAVVQHHEECHLKAPWWKHAGM